MLKLLARSLALSLASLLCLEADAGSGLPEPNWSRAEALQAAEEIDAVAALGPLLRSAREGQSRELVQALADVEANRDWSLPARERVLYEFVVSLGDLPPYAVDDSVLHILMRRQPAVLVPHPDHPSAGVPLYNVKAAAAGVAWQWKRQAAYATAGALYREGGEAWLVAYRSAEAAQRPGFVDALDSLSPQALQQVAEVAMQALSDDPSLTRVVARAASLLHDPELLGLTLEAGSGPGLAAALRSARTEWDEPDRTWLLHHAAQQAPPSVAALALTELAPGLLQRPETAALLFKLLGNPELGAAAALVLAGSGDSAIHGRLLELAEQGAGLNSKRASLALSMIGHDRAGAGR